MNISGKFKKNKCMAKMTHHYFMCKKKVRKCTGKKPDDENSVQREEKFGAPGQEVGERKNSVMDANKAKR